MRAAADAMARHWWPLLLAALALGVLLNIVWPIPVIKSDAGGMTPPEAQPFAPGDLASFVSLLTADGRRDYLLLQVVDIGFIALYAGGLVGGIRRKVQAGRGWLILVPLVAALADLGEDALITSMLLSHPAQPVMATALFPIVAMTKWIAIVASLLLLGGLVLRDRLGRRRTDPTVR